MTSAFEEFMRQHRMTGSEKADGYSPEVFVGLSESEKEIVFKALESELPWSAKWLFELDKDRALTVLKNLEEKLRGDPYEDVYMMQFQLVKHGGDLCYQKHMIEDYFNYPENSKFRVLNSIANTPVTDELRNFLKKVILVEANDDAVTTASIYLLKSVGLKKTTKQEKEKYDRLMDRLCDDKIEIKNAALANVERIEKNFEK